MKLKIAENMYSYARSMILELFLDFFFSFRGALGDFNFPIYRGEYIYCYNMAKIFMQQFSILTFSWKSFGDATIKSSKKIQKVVVFVLGAVHKVRQHS